MSNSPPTQGPGLEQARTAAGLTVEAFAQLAGISKATYYNAVNETHAPNPQTRRQISDVLEQLASCPRIDRVSELEAKVNQLSEQVKQLAEATTGAVA